MEKVIMMVGIPGSGKSTYAQKIAEQENAVVISSDKLREEMFGSVWEFRRNEKLFAEMYSRAHKLLAEGRSIVLDATNINRRQRKSILNKFKPFYKECYYIKASLKKALAQNAERDRKVNEDVVRRMHFNLDEPQCNEGWDRINVIREGALRS